MIDIKELRIGNILKGENGPVIVSILSDDNRVAVKYPNHAPLFAQDAKEMSIEPIPLTEDILLKCGFERYSLGFIINFPGCNLRSRRIMVAKVLNTYSISWACFDTPRIRIKYLHELQNLFYDLTKTELNVQL